MSKETIAHLEALRDAMKKAHVDAVIIPGTDAHQSEYVCNHWKIRDWLTGFTGSNGTAVVTLNDGKLWTDSRYFLQAADQLKDSGFELMKEDIPGEPSINDWLAEQLEPGSVIAIDGTLFSIIKVSNLENFCGHEGFRLATDFTPFDTIWTDRPSRPECKIFIHNEEYSGESTESRIERTLEAVEKAGADALFISALDEVAWLYNIRSNDVKFTPVAIAFAYVSEKKKVLFIDVDKVDSEAKETLNDNGVEILPYESVVKFLNKIPEEDTVIVDPNTVSDTLGMAMNCTKMYIPSPIALLKAVKNEVQIAGTKNAMTRDGIALVRTFIWLEQNVDGGKITEIDLWKKAQEMRGAEPLYKGDSFAMIAGYKEHGAIVHYSATQESNATLKPEGLLLVDTGAQYLDGTTDITRTISLGNPTKQEIHDYTLVLKGHIAIATQIFPVGTRGAQLDALARQFMWKEGVTYFHGTGHGVGQYLSVHEGPQSIRLNENATILEPGMITSDEPGIYRAGEYGIRIENLTLVVSADKKSKDFGEFLKFETLTLFPYDNLLIDVNMLSDEELKFINDYHAHVLNVLSPGLNEGENAWLQDKTKKLERKR